MGKSAELPGVDGQRLHADLALASIGAVALAWGLVRTTDVGWGSPQVIGALVLGALLIASLMAWERRAGEPMLPPRLPRIPAFATGFLFSANGHLGSPATVNAGFRPALAAAAGLSVAGALTELGVGARRGSPSASRQQAPALTSARS